MSSSLLRRTPRFSTTIACVFSPFTNIQPHKSFYTSSSSLLFCSSKTKRSIQPFSKSNPSSSPSPLFHPLCFSSCVSPSVNKRLDHNLKLKQAVESEIECIKDPRLSKIKGLPKKKEKKIIPRDKIKMLSAEDPKLTSTVSKTEEELPFEIIDDPCDKKLILKRQFEGESLQLVVEMIYVREHSDMDYDRTRDYYEKPVMYITVTVVKGDSGFPFQIWCTLKCDEECIIINRGPEDFYKEDPNYDGYKKIGYMDARLQEILLDYFQRRGITAGPLQRFLRNYMEKKRQRDYLTFLQNVKEFVEK